MLGEGLASVALCAIILRMHASGMRALIIDDDVDLGTGLALALGRVGLLADVATTGEEAAALVERHPAAHYDVLLMDVEMPGVSGWELIQVLRDQQCLAPVIFITAHGSLEERLRGLELGADDYLVKPFEPEELVARIQAVLRRTRALPTLKVHDLRIDLGSRSVERLGKRIDLSPREFGVLLALAEAGGATVSKERLLSKVWGAEEDRPDSTAVEVQIARLRKKIDAVEPTLIHTEPRRGYRLAAVHRIDFHASDAPRKSLARTPRDPGEIDVDALDRIVRLDGSWADSARWLGLGDTSADEVVGRSFWDCVTGSDAAEFYQRVFRDVRSDSTEFALRFGGSTDGRGGGQLTIRSTAGGVVEIRGRRESADGAKPAKRSAVVAGPRCAFCSVGLAGAPGTGGLCSRCRSIARESLAVSQVR